MRGPGREVGRGNEEKETRRKMKHSEEGQVMNELTVACQLESFSGWW